MTINEPVICVPKVGIACKRSYYPLYNSGHFGNKATTWDSLDECLLDSVLKGMTVTIRSTVPGGPCIYGLAPTEVERQLGGVPSEVYTLAETIDPSANKIQGYLMEQDGEWYFDYSVVKKSMRDALAEETLHMKGRHKIKTLLKEVMDRPSWSNFKNLRRMYPGHVFELSVFDRPVGTDGWNTIVWEVRKY